MRDQRSEQAQAWRAWWSSSRWIKLRNRHKLDHPLCVMCLQEKRVTAVEVVDHIRPHKGDEELFYDPDNLQSLCKFHHDSTKQRQEKRGKAQHVIGLDGWPVEQ